APPAARVRRSRAPAALCPPQAARGAAAAPAGRPGPVRTGAAAVSGAALRPAPADADVEIFGVFINTAPPADLLRQILAYAERGEHRRVAYVNAHVINQSFEIPELRRSLRGADLVYCDGYGVRLAARTIGLPVPHRMTGADWIWALAALC